MLVLLGPESSANNWENNLVLSSAAITAPNIDIAKSLIAMFGMFIRVFVTPTRNTEMPNKNAKRPKKREAWAESDANLIRKRCRKSKQPFNCTLMDHLRKSRAYKMHT